MKIKTSDLTGTALDWAASAARGDSDIHPYSTNWDDGGPIIEREGIGIYRECVLAYPDFHPVQGKTWEAIIGLYLVGEHEAQGAHGLTAQGATALEAAMRVFVLSKLGDEVDVPEELLS